MTSRETLEQMVKDKKLNYFMVVYCHNLLTPGSSTDYFKSGYQARANMKNGEHAISIYYWNKTEEEALDGLLKYITEPNEN